MTGRVVAQGDGAARRTYLALRRTENDLVVVPRRMAREPRPTIRILRSGVCGTDLDILRGVRADAAAVLGHEGIGEVAGTDAGGRRVVFNPVDPANQDRILGHGYDGLFQQRLVEPTVGLVDALPELPLDLGPLVEPLAVARYAWRLLSRDRSPQSVGIWGGGTAAVLCSIVAQQHGAAVHLFHDRTERLDWLREQGVLGEATAYWSTRARWPEIDAAVLCTSRRGFGEALSQAVGCLVPGGTIDLYGGVAPGGAHGSLPNVDLAEVRRRNVCGLPPNGDQRPARSASGKMVRLVGHRGTAAHDLVLAQAALRADPELFGRIVSHVVSLRHAAQMIPRLLRAVGTGREEYLKIVIDLWMARPQRAVHLAPQPATPVRSD